ncbi:unnamed protein product [Nesidiocoris tenuis]|uniref:Uncharacterized protein n=1 Tax=Nesidiocoris tenuis TaxID=355587 RepID=A0A6H5GAR0_9HEMI|nr:unnamed protein product [Nesidiocoris tenuis]
MTVVILGYVPFITSSSTASTSLFSRLRDFSICSRSDMLTQCTQRMSMKRKIIDQLHGILVRTWAAGGQTSSNNNVLPITKPTKKKSKSTKSQRRRRPATTEATPEPASEMVMKLNY